METASRRTACPVPPSRCATTQRCPTLSVSRSPSDPWYFQGVLIYWYNTAVMQRYRMKTIERLKEEIGQLSGDELAELARWLSESHWKSWDTQIEADSQAGRLDFLIDEVQAEKSEGRITDL